MNSTPNSGKGKASLSQPGVIENRYGGYHIHMLLNEREAPLVGSGGSSLEALGPQGSPTLAGMSVFEDCILFALKGGDAIVVHASDPAVAGSVVYFYHASGILWRAVPVEQLNAGWVPGAYHFRGDLRKFDKRLIGMRSCPAMPSWRRAATFWATGGWQEAVVYTSQTLVWRLRGWQHSCLPEPQLSMPGEEQVESLNSYPADVQQILAQRGQGVEKVTYQVGGLHLALSYLERIGLAEAVNRYCPRQGAISDGMVITVLVINRILKPCALSNIAAWMANTGLHFLLGIPTPSDLNYDRLADALLAVYPHWQAIAAEVTLRAVEQFQLKVETVHYDLTSVFFHGEYQGSEWVEFGYSRDKRPDKRQVNIGISTTADGEVVLPEGSGVHSGSTNDATTTVAVHERLHKLFQRSDLLVTGDRIMQSAENMLSIARSHGRFLGPVDWTPYIRTVVASCPEKDFETLPTSTKIAGHEVKATSRRLRFEVKEKLSDDERKRLAQRRRQRRLRGRVPIYRHTHFWMRAAIILDTARQKADAARRIQRIEAYETELEWVCEHLNKGRYYGDPEWVSGHLADLKHQFKAVRSFVKITFTHSDGMMHLAYQRQDDKIAQASRLDGKWVLITNQPPIPDQPVVDYLDWMWRVYKNHCHVERRMRNLKSDLPIRPIYLHRDDLIVALCFVCVIALMLYTLIERDCHNNPSLLAAGLRTTTQVLNALSTFCLTVFLTPSGYEVFWLDSPTEQQALLWRELSLADPGTRLPTVRSASQVASLAENSASFWGFDAIKWHSFAGYPLQLLGLLFLMRCLSARLLDW